ncbi:MFS transporter [Paenibacillus sp. GCM10023252]|uniref:MFS transporter n=1 Tax=Paenibacillus sp. GCM10023252 TaxID=3252649 RepID=UPI0036231B98
MNIQMEQHSTASMMKLGMPMSKGVWHNARIDFGASILFSLFNVVLNQFYIPFAIQDGATNVQVGLLSAAPAIGLLFSPLWAILIERSGNPRPFVVIPNLIGRLLLFLPAFYPTPVVYVAAAILFQLLMGIQAPAYAALVSRIYPADLRGRLMGYVRVAMGTLMIPLAYVVGLWAEGSGPAGPLITAAIFGAISILLFNTIRMPEPAAQPSPSARSFSIGAQWQLIRDNRVLAVFLAATTFAGFGNMLSNPIYQIVQVDTLSLSNIEIGYARIAYFTGLLLTYLIAGRLLDRIDIKYTLICGIAAYAIVPMLYGMWGTYPAVIVGNGIQGIGEAIWDIGILAFIFRLAPGREAAVFGLHLMLFGIRGTLGPIIGASLSTSVPLSDILLLAALCGWIGTALFVVGNFQWRKSRRSRNEKNSRSK